MQMHFFLLLPAVLYMLRKSQNFRRHCTIAISGFFVFGVVVRVAMAYFLQVLLPVPPFAHEGMGNFDKDVAVRFYHALYFSTPARICNFAAGVLLGLALQNNQFIIWVRKFQFVLAGVFSGCLYWYFNSVLLKPYGANDIGKWSHATLQSSMLYHGSPFLSLFLCLGLLWLVCSTGLIASSARKSLSSPVMLTLGKVLLHRS